MKVCLDTNVLLQALDATHPFNTLLTAWMNGSFEWVVSTPILLEYEEVIVRMSGPVRWKQFLHFVELAQAAGSFLEQATSWYQFQIVQTDPDDNIFTDCAVTADADYVVTEDRHFQILRKSGFRPQPIAPVDFISRHLRS